MKSLLSQWYIWAMLSACFAALTAIFGKVGVENIDSNLATLIRTALILMIVALVAAGTGSYRVPANITLNTWIFLALSSLATGFSWLCYYRALKLGSAAGVASIDKLSVLIVAILSVIFLGERLMIWNWMGIGMIAIGAILVAVR